MQRSQTQNITSPKLSRVQVQPQQLQQEQIRPSTAQNRPSSYKEIPLAEKPQSPVPNRGQKIQPFAQLAQMQQQTYTSQQFEKPQSPGYPQAPSSYPQPPLFTQPNPDLNSSQRSFK